jgi:hypothetical protein
MDTRNCSRLKQIEYSYQIAQEGGGGGTHLYGQQEQGYKGYKGGCTI